MYTTRRQYPNLCSGIRIPGVDTTTPIDVTPSWFGASTTHASDINIPGVTTVTDDCLVVGFAATDGSDITPNSTPSSGWAFQAEIENPTNDSAGCGVGYFTKTQTTAGATGTLEADFSQAGTDGAIGILVAIRPSGGGSTVTGTASGSIGTVTGDAATTLRGVDGAASGSIGTISGAAATTLRGVSAAASGDVGSFVGSATAATGPTGTGAGSIGAVVGSAATLRGVTGALVGTVAVAGTAASTLRGTSGSATGLIGNVVGAASTVPAGTFLYTPPTSAGPRPLPYESLAELRRKGPRKLNPSVTMGLTVLLNGSTYTSTALPTTAEIKAADAVYQGGRTHTVTGAVKVAIEASGVGGTFEQAGA